MEDNQVVYTGGAKRSQKLPLYSAVPLSFIRRIAETLAEGHEKYDGGLPIAAHNWKLGDRQFALDVFEHAILHLQELKEQALDGFLGAPNPFSGEDNLGHLVANLIMIDFFQAKGMYSPEQSEATVTSDPTLEADVEMDKLPETQEAAETVTAKVLRILTGAAA